MLDQNGSQQGTASQSPAEEVFDYGALIAGAYPTDERLDLWADAFGRLVGHGAGLVLLWGNRQDDKALEKMAKVRAKAKEAGKDPGKAEWQARKGPQHTQWRTSRPTAEAVVDHLCVGGWIGARPETLGLAFGDVDWGGEAAADAAEARVGQRAIYREPTGTPGRLHLGWPCRGEVKGRKWKLPEGGGEIIRSGHQVVVWDPVALLAAVEAAQGAPEADVSRLAAKGDDRTVSLDLTPTSDASALHGAIADAVGKVADADAGDRNDTAAGQAWRVGLAAAHLDDADAADAACDAVVDAAVDASPDEPDKARETASRQFREGYAAGKGGVAFEIRVKGARGDTSGHDDAIQEDEVVTSDDVAAFEVWRNDTDGLPEPEAPDMSKGGFPMDVSECREIRKGEMGFDSHVRAASLVAFERAFPDWIIDSPGTREKGVPDVWGWTDGEGWHALPWKAVSTPLLRFLCPRHYTLEKDTVEYTAKDGTMQTEQVWKPRPRPTTGGATGMAINVAKEMAGVVDFYTDRDWHDWSPLVAAYPDGTCLDILTGERRPQHRNDRMMRRTGIAPAAEWRGTWTEQTLTENVPSESDRFLFQCVLGACLIGYSIGEAFIWLVGPGGSGKTGTAEAAARAIGPDYTHVMPIQRVLAGRKGAQSDPFTQASGRAKLEDARLVLMTGEPDAEDVLDSGAYKSLSGGGSSEGRRKGSDTGAIYGSTYTPLATANHPPFVTKPDNAVERRSYVIAFPNERPKGTGDDRVKLRMLRREHLAEMLAFIAEGAVMVTQHGGLPPRTDQQMRRAVFPVMDSSDDAGGQSTAARQTHRAGKRSTVIDGFKRVIGQHTRQETGAVVWLDERAPEADGDLITELDAVLHAGDGTRYEASARNRAKYAQRAGFSTTRKRPGNGNRDTLQCLVDRILVR